MRYFLIDDLRAEETKRLCEHLDAMDLGAGLDGIYWLPIPAHMLSAVQKEHESQCGPYVMALECEETSLRLELLVRARGRIRCECVGFVSFATIFPFFVIKISSFADNNKYFPRLFFNSVAVIDISPLPFFVLLLYSFCTILSMYLARKYYSSSTLTFFRFIHK